MAHRHQPPGPMVPPEKAQSQICKTTLFQARKGNDIHHQQGAELWSWNHLGFGVCASADEEGGSGATPEDSPGDTREQEHKVHQSTPGHWKR